MTGESVERRKLRAAPEAVDEVCGELRAGMLARLPERERFIVELLAREALMNAVQHGRGAGEIDCEIRMAPESVVIAVKDGGAGFDWQGWKDRVRDPLGESGRGLELMHHYADRVEFSGRGNELQLTRMFAKDGQGDAN